MKKTFWVTLAFSLGYLVLALVCLVQAGAHPWSLVDRYSGGYLALRFLGSLHSLLSSRGVFRSKNVMREWWALDSDPAGPKWVMLLMGLDLAVFLEYGHWQILPGLAQPVLQSIGLGLYLAVTVWQTWTDIYLAKYFTRNEATSLPMSYGPYRYVRHPRYAAAILGKGAMALALASVFGWLLVIAWSVLLLRKIAVEEKHLRELFGPGYESYARTTAKVIPGIY